MAVMVVMAAMAVMAAVCMVVVVEPPTGCGNGASGTCLNQRLPQSQVTEAMVVKVVALAQAMLGPVLVRSGMEGAFWVWLLPQPPTAAHLDATGMVAMGSLMTRQHLNPGSSGAVAGYGKNAMTDAQPASIKAISPTT
eukprot:gene4861-5106_t